MNLIKGIYKLTRIEQVIPYALFLTLLSAFVVDAKVEVLRLLLVLVANILGACFANIINDVEDAEDDSLDPKKAKRNPVSAGIITKKQGYFITLAEGTIALILYAIAGTAPLGAGIAVIATGFFYSWKPIRLKSVAWIDFLSHQYFLGSGLVLASYFAFSHLSSDLILPLIGSGFLSASGDLYNELRDFIVDRKSNLKNTAQLLGEKTTAIIRAVFTVLGGVAIVAAIAIDYRKIYLPVLAIVPLILIPFVLYNRLKSKTSLIHFDNSLIYDPLLYSFSIVLGISIFVN